MANTFLEQVFEIFYKTSTKQPADVSLSLSDRISYPMLNFSSPFEIVLPLPKVQEDKYLFEGFLFENTDEGRQKMWFLFLSSIYHLAAHSAVSDYSLYEKWCKNKTHEICWQVIDFIEDAVVEKYLSAAIPEVWNCIQKINHNLINSSKRHQDYVNQHGFSQFYLRVNQDKIEAIKKQILVTRDEVDHAKTLLECADLLYKNKILLPNLILPYVEHHNYMNTLQIPKMSPEFEIGSVFKEKIPILDDLWYRDERRKTKMLARYRKNLEGLHFDDINIPDQDVHSFLQVKDKNSMMIRKIRNQIRTVNNTVDDPRTEEMGSVDMQAAIQAIAANKQFDIFEQEFARRREESWVILVDNSASMKLRFNKVKELLVSLSESADELTGREGTWALYGFDNNFSILKDFGEKYSQEIRGRIGGIKSGGLSFIPDAIELAARILAEDPSERKYIFIFTDAYPSGYEGVDIRFQETVKLLDKLGIKAIGIGLSNNIQKFFKIHCTGEELREIVAKFISSYRSAASQYL